MKCICRRIYRNLRKERIPRAPLFVQLGGMFRSRDSLNGAVSLLELLNKVRYSLLILGSLIIKLENEEPVDKHEIIGREKKIGAYNMQYTVVDVKLGNNLVIASKM